jgi:hypothetical protein
LKVIKSWYVKIVVYIFIISFLSHSAKLLFYVDVKQQLSQLNLYYPISLMFGLIYVCFVVVFIFEFFNGEKFIETFYVPISDFKIEKYENGMIIIKLNDNAWAVLQMNEKYIPKDYIKLFKIYNRKKELVRSDIGLPYLR